MIKYINLSKNSAVDSYEIKNDSIIVKFKDDDAKFVYDSTKPGKSIVDEMKKKAIIGKGLMSYITKKVKKNYFKKI